MSRSPRSTEPTERLTRSLKRLVAVALASVGFALGAVMGAAEEPTGFAGLSWGSPPAKVREALKARCQFTEPLEAFKQACQGYQIGDAPGKLTLLFVPGHGLSGWDFACQPDRAGALAAQITERFGRPSQEGSAMAYWHWSWGSASLYKRECSVSVATNRALAHMQKIDQERSKQQKKDF